MKVHLEVREGNKITTYSADLGEPERVVKSVADKVEDFLKKTFKKEVFTKETKEG
jgi:hypothetical protein